MRFTNLSTGVTGSGSRPTPAGFGQLHTRQRILYRRNVEPGKISLPWAKQMREIARSCLPGPGSTLKVPLGNG
jgi:hypothetical protein